MERTHLELFKARLQDAAPENALRDLAVRLRDDGIAQADLFLLFSYFQQRLSPKDPRYDPVGDTMDLICGGPWAKGRDLFPTELDTESVKAPRAVPPLPWLEVNSSGDPCLEQELAREVGPAHVLAKRSARALVRRSDRDDVLFAIRESPEVALVHLTWSGTRERAGFPATRIFASMLDWFEEVETAPQD